MEQTKQQTALDLFIAALKEWKVEDSLTDYEFKIPKHIFDHMEKRVKQMEKEQTVNARESGKWEITKCINDPNYTFPTSEQYYNETYGTDKTA